MVGFISSRLLRTIITIWVVLTVAFVLARLTGDPVRLMLPQEATQEQVEEVRADLGLDQPMLVQYGNFLGKAVRADFGDSIRQGTPAIEAVVDRLPATLSLAVIAFVVGFGTALILAVVGELTESQKLRTAMLWMATTRQAIPAYVFGIVLILIFAVHWSLLPSLGNVSAASYVLPVATVCTFEIALYLRLFNSSFAESRNDDYIRTVRAKGVSRTRVVLAHMLPNALLPVITIAGINLGILIGSLVVIESVFTWPGLASLIVQGVQQRDYPIVQAGVIVIAIIFVVINLVVDMLYAVLDPRVRLSR
jgi:peptide/nickel transport system permease protein